ncbi:unnamed protein product [Caenorhabditis angaria]|uniref:Uncharacterized protein n=1 Tax=Caenorhabditis angaria TaxID=860376 RepID=A0A9P1IMJ4_9PELO|nr:unnamed protein product [Caenorhabditis angaria]
MGKRRRNEDEEDYAEKQYENGFDSINNDDDSSLEELHALKWSGDDEVLSKPRIKTDSGTYRTVVSSKIKKRKMVHVPAVREVTKQDSKNIKASAPVEGMIQILPKEVKTKHLGGSIYEEGEEPEEDAVIHPLLKQIKKTAVLDLSTRIERNKSYGIKK